MTRNGFFAVSKDIFLGKFIRNKFKLLYQQTDKQTNKSTNRKPNSQAFPPTSHIPLLPLHHAHAK